MPITIKKKSLKLNTPEPVDGDAGQATAAEEAAVTAMAPSPPQKSGGSFAPFVIMGVLACALLGALIAVQVIENSSYTGAIPQAGR